MVAAAALMAPDKAVAELKHVSFAIFHMKKTKKDAINHQINSHHVHPDGPSTSKIPLKICGGRSVAVHVSTATNEASMVIKSLPRRSCENG